MRRRVLCLVESPAFTRTIVVLILLNGVTLGLETSPHVLSAHGGLLIAVDKALVCIFVTEIALRAYAHGRRFLRDPWNVFDLVVISVALLPSSGPFSVLRILRVLRVLRLLSVIPSLRMVVTGLFRALPGMASISVLLALLLYVSGVMATTLFRDAAPQYFGDLWISLFTLFQIMTGDGWSQIALQVMEHRPLAWVFFIIFILVSTFIALNLFIAVAVEALEHAPDPGGEEDGTKDETGPEPDPVLTELRLLREEVAEMHRERSGS